MTLAGGPGLASLEYGHQTDGAFDITIGSVSLLWDFVNAVKPVDEEIAEGLKHIDYSNQNLEFTCFESVPVVT